MGSPDIGQVEDRIYPKGMMAVELYGLCQEAVGRKLEFVAQCGRYSVEDMKSLIEAMKNIMGKV